MIWSMCWVALVGVGTLLDLLTVSTILSQQNDFREQGGDVTIVTAPGSISGARCAELGRVSGVVGSMAIREAQTPLPVAALPRTAPRLFEFTGGVSSVVGATIHESGGVVLSDELKAITGANRSDRLPLVSGESVLVAGSFVWPDDGRDSMLSGAALAEMPSGEVFDQCWVRIWPPDDRLEPMLAYTLVPGEYTPPQLTSLNPSTGSATPTGEMLERRVTGGIWWVLIGLGVVLGGVSSRSRRVELASNMQVGAGRAVLLLQSMIEACWWVVPATGLVMAMNLIITRLGIDPIDMVAVFSNQAATILAVSGTTVLAAGIATLTVRRRSLYTYIKER